MRKKFRHTRKIWNCKIKIINPQFKKKMLIPDTLPESQLGSFYRYETNITTFLRRLFYHLVRAISGLKRDAKLVEPSR
jgi:hypothetical protein